MNNCNNIKNKNNNNDNLIILPELNIYIKRIIIDLLLNHDKIDMNDNNFNNTNLINLSLVSKQFFKIIMNINKPISIFSATDIKNGNYYEGSFKNEMEFNNKYIKNLSNFNHSLYNFNNINKLNIYLVAFEHISIDRLLDFLKLFETNGVDIDQSIENDNSVGNRKKSRKIIKYKLDIVKINCPNYFSSTISLKLVYNIIEYLESINSAIQIHIILNDTHIGGLSYDDTFKEDLLSKYSLERFKHCIKSCNYNTFHWVNSDEEYFKAIGATSKYWCVDSINTDYTFSSYRVYYDFSFLLTDFKFKSYSIKEIYYLPPLIQALQTNQNLKSLEIYIDYSIHRDGYSNHDCTLVTDFGYLDNDENNTHQQWIEFCDSLSSNKTLKYLFLKNGCFDTQVNDDIDDIDDIDDDSPIIPAKETEQIKLNLDSFKKVFKFNSTLKSIGFKYFDENTVYYSLIEILNSDKSSIQSIAIYPEDYHYRLNYSKKTIDVLCEIVKTKTNFKKLEIHKKLFTETTLQESNIIDLYTQYNIKLSIDQSENNDTLY